ncbi:hypothetical protein GCM10017778_21550 [Streptomyces vinaceus]|nr:hypothetical protein GCM10017778_21550 [Streptomyces vinaceus]
MPGTAETCGPWCRVRAGRTSAAPIPWARATASTSSRSAPPAPPSDPQTADIAGVPATLRAAVVEQVLHPAQPVGALPAPAGRAQGHQYRGGVGRDQYALGLEGGPDRAGEP